MSDVAPSLVLTAGLGTRLRPLTLVRAKPAVPLAGEPLIRRIISWLVSSRVTHLTLNLHHLPQTITSVVGDGSDLGASIRYSWEQPMVLGSAGGPGQALSILGSDTFFIINGDTLTDVDLTALHAAHARSDALVTLAVTPNTEPLKYGGVVLDDDGRVVDFVRRGPAATGSHHFVGAQIVSRQAFASVLPGAIEQSIGGVYNRLIADRPGSIRGLVSACSFLDIGTVSDYVKSSATFALASSAPAAAQGRVAPTARITDSILWDDVEIGDAAVLERCIVTDHVSIAPAAAYRDQILIARDGGVATFPIGQL